MDDIAPKAWIRFIVKRRTIFEHLRSNRNDSQHCEWAEDPSASSLRTAEFAVKSLGWASLWTAIEG